MNELFDETQPNESTPIEIQRLFVDEAGDPTLFHSSGKPIVGTEGCSRFFIIGKLEVDDPPALSQSLTELRQELLDDLYFAGVESFRPERKKTALLFHAKDDLPEVRYRVFNLLRAAGSALRFHAVVCDKQALLKSEMERRTQDPRYRYQPDTIYDGLIRSLCSKFHRLADRYEICVAKRGAKDRNQAIRAAIETCRTRLRAEVRLFQRQRRGLGHYDFQPKRDSLFASGGLLLVGSAALLRSAPTPDNGRRASRG